MTFVLAIASEDQSVRVLGARHGAIKFRDRLTRQLESGDTVQVDFSGAFVSQAFVDELLGPLILRTGPSVLEKLTFSGCSDDTRAILNLVLAGRLRDHSSLKARGAISNGDCAEEVEARRGAAALLERVRDFVSEAYHDHQESVCPDDASRPPRRHPSLT